jgi:hypothetical protein
MTRVAVSYRLRRRVRLRSELLPRSRMTVLEHPAGRQEHIAEVFVRAVRAARTADSTARGWISAIRQYPSIARRDGYGPIGGTAVKCEGLSPNDSFRRSRSRWTPRRPAAAPRTRFYRYEPRGGAS